VRCWAIRPLGTAGLLLFALVSACDQKGSQPAPAVASTASNVPAPPPELAASASAAPSAKGAELVRLVKQVITQCTFEKSEPAYDCPALAALHDTPLIDEGASDATLIGLLEDADPRVRKLALAGLDQRGESKQKYVSDKALAERVVAAAEKEKDFDVDGRALGEAVGRIQVATTGTWARIKALVTGTGRVPFRTGILWNLLGKTPRTTKSTRRWSGY
jgi:hypothetical protein